VFSLVSTTITGQQSPEGSVIPGFNPNSFPDPILDPNPVPNLKSHSGVI